MVSETVGLALTGPVAPSRTFPPYKSQPACALPAASVVERSREIVRPSQPGSQACREAGESVHGALGPYIAIPYALAPMLITVAPPRWVPKYSLKGLLTTRPGPENIAIPDDVEVV